MIVLSIYSKIIFAFECNIFFFLPRQYTLARDSQLWSSRRLFFFSISIILIDEACIYAYSYACTNLKNSISAIHSPNATYNGGIDSSRLYGEVLSDLICESGPQFMDIRIRLHTSALYYVANLRRLTAYFLLEKEKRNK